MAAAKREARRRFGDDTILVEQYVEHGRHIEVQVMADTHGNVIHLWERDCSHAAPSPEGSGGGAGADHQRRRSASW